MEPRSVVKTFAQQYPQLEHVADWVTRRVILEISRRTPAVRNMPYAQQGVLERVIEKLKLRV